MASSLAPPPPPPPGAGRIGRLTGRREPQYPPGLTWGLGDFWIGSAIWFFGSIPLGVVAVLASDEGIDVAWLPFLLVVPAAAQASYVFWAGRTKGRGVRLDFAVRFRPRDIALGAAIFVVGLLLAGLVAAAIDWLFDTTPTAAVADVIQNADGDSGGISPWIILMAVLGATAVPFIEEVVYRGLLWSALEKRGVREHWVYVTTSAIFAAVHLEPVRSPVLFVLGLALGYGRLRTGRIGPSVAAHVFINTAAMTALLSTL